MGLTGGRASQAGQQENPSRPQITEALVRAAERISEIVSASERALEVLQAETQAHLPNPATASNRDRLVGELIRTLVERTELLRSEAEGLAWSLERAGRQLAAHDVPKQAATPQPSTNGPAKSRPSEGVRLLATQMAVAGSSPEEIAERLRSEFGIENAPALVAQMLDPSATRGGQAEG